MIQGPVYLFYSYAHEDEDLRNELVGHLKIMERKGIIHSWHDRKILPGMSWDDEIKNNLGSADLILLLISSDFIKSDYIWSNEVRIAMDRHANNQAHVVPVMLRAVDIEGAPFASLQGLPKDFKPVTSWKNRDEAWVDVAKGLRKIVSIIKRKPYSHEKIISKNIDADISLLEVNNPVNELSSKAANNNSLLLEINNVKDTLLKNGQVDKVLLQIIQNFTSVILDAAERHMFSSINMQAVNNSALILIDIPKQICILWVDDRPDQIQLEKAAFAKLQIEVITVETSEQALNTIAKGYYSIDLVLSSWDRPEELGGAPSAGIKLLHLLKAAKSNTPVIYYHTRVKSHERELLHDITMNHGADGEAIKPDELISLVTNLLSNGRYYSSFFVSDSYQNKTSKYIYPDRLQYKLETQSSSLETTVLQRQPGLLESIIEKSNKSSIYSKELSQTLFQLMIPLEVRDTIQEVERLLFILDGYTSKIPWEMMQGDDSPLAVRIIIVRQFAYKCKHVKCPYKNSRNKSTHAYNSKFACVISNPSTEGFYKHFHVDGSNKNYQNFVSLPSAIIEANVVRTQLQESNYIVEALYPVTERASAPDVLNMLYKYPYQILMITGHGVCNAKNTSGQYQTGVVLSDGCILTAAEIAQMDVLPELVFLNCCHLDKTDNPDVNYTKFAYSVSRELIEMGVRCIITASWAVDDNAANTFAEKFFQEISGNKKTFGESVLTARKEVYYKYPNSNTWGAYQAYGDPNYRLY